MSAAKQITSIGGNSVYDDTLFTLIARDIEKQGYSIRPGALPEVLSSELLSHQQSMQNTSFRHAGTGRGDDFLNNVFVRTDEICWINGESNAGSLWLHWASRLQHFLNRHLILGLFSFESHFAHYGPGDYYKRHYDAFRGEANRILSIVVYLNTDWLNTDGGELVLYINDNDNEGIKVVPLYGTVVTFLSEEFPHEVLPARRDRYSVAGWFRVNTSMTHKVDPPR